MSKKIGILRGINVGGKRKILMKDLKLICQNIGLQQTETYIQSGNIIFNSENNNHTIEDHLEKAIKSKYGFDVPVIIRNLDSLNKTIKNNPFIRSTSSIKKLHLTFLKSLPNKDLKHSLTSFNFENDSFFILDKDVFLKCEGNFHKTKLSNNFFEKHLNVKCTTRNWNTVLKIQQIASN